MSWPYHFVSLTEPEQHLRRELLDRYGAYAQLSALIPVFAYQLYRLAYWVSSARQNAKPGYSLVPGSPVSKKFKASPQGAFSRSWRAFLWWLEGDVIEGWGLRMHWIAGLAWASWLLFLAVHETGVDYLHATKRFGVIAASQFPVHYMLSMKGRYSPFAIAFNASHEQLNPWHRISGRIIYSFLILHATWYMNFFVQAGLLKVRLTSLVPLLGVGAFCLLTILVTSALATVRRWNYRVFFVLHLSIGTVILPILFFHAAPLRLYTTESLVLFCLDIIARKLDTFQGFATLIPIQGTNLLTLTIPIPPSKAQRFTCAPGQHVYLSLPRASRPNPSYLSIYDILYNPFTIADVTPTSISLVLRTLHGPTTQALKLLERLPKAKPPINVEGPYGSVHNFPNLVTGFDRVLLVAGGVGASFIVPIYRHLVSAVTDNGLGTVKVEFHWSMRAVAEAAWTSSVTDDLSTLANDDRVKIYITGVHADVLDDPDSSVAQPEQEDGSIELDDLDRDEQETLLATGSSGNKRPDLKAIVDNTFRHGEHDRVAILVCGPAEMSQELRHHVGRWVGRGRYVFWHNEAFGW